MNQKTRKMLATAVLVLVALAFHGVLVVLPLTTGDPWWLGLAVFYGGAAGVVALLFTIKLILWALDALADR